MEGKKNNKLEIQKTENLLNKDVTLTDAENYLNQKEEEREEEHNQQIENINSNTELTEEQKEEKKEKLNKNKEKLDEVRENKTEEQKEQEKENIKDALQTKRNYYLNNDRFNSWFLQQQKQEKGKTKGQLAENFKQNQDAVFEMYLNSLPLKEQKEERRKRAGIESKDLSEVVENKKGLLKEETVKRIEKTREVKRQIQEKSQKIDELKDQYKNKGFFKQAFGILNPNDEGRQVKKLQEEIKKLQKERMQFVLNRVNEKSESEDISDERREQLERRKQKIAEATNTVSTNQEKADNERKFEGKGKEMISKIAETKLASWYLKQSRVTKMVISAGAVSMFLPGAFATNVFSRISGGVAGMIIGGGVGKFIEKNYDKHIDILKLKQEQELKNFKGTPEERFDFLEKQKAELGKLEKRKFYVTMGMTAVTTVLTSMEARGQVGEHIFDQNQDHTGFYSMDYLDKMKNGLNKLFGINIPDMDRQVVPDFFMGSAHAEDFESVPKGLDVGEFVENKINNVVEKVSEVKENIEEGIENFVEDVKTKMPINYEVKEDDSLWKILIDKKSPQVKEFWKSIGAENFSDVEKNNLIANLVKRIERSSELKNEFINLHPEDRINLVDERLRKLILEGNIKGGGVNYNNLVKRADVLDKTTDAVDIETKVVDSADNTEVGKGVSDGADSDEKMTTEPKQPHQRTATETVQNEDVKTSQDINQYSEYKGTEEIEEGIKQTMNDSKPIIDLDKINNDELAKLTLTSNSGVVVGNRVDVDPYIPAPPVDSELAGSEMYQKYVETQPIIYEKGGKVIYEIDGKSYTFEFNQNMLDKGEIIEILDKGEGEYLRKFYYENDPDKVYGITEKMIKAHIKVNSAINKVIEQGKSKIGDLSWWNERRIRKYYNIPSGMSGDEFKSIPLATFANEYTLKGELIVNNQVNLK